MQDFKCVSHTAFRKFDHYIGKVMNRNMTSDVIYCEYDDVFMRSNSDVYEWSDEDLTINSILEQPEPEEVSPELSTLEIMQAAAFNPDFLPIPEYVLNNEVKNLALTPEMEFFNFTNGEYEYLIYKDVQLRDRELQIKKDF